MNVFSIDSVAHPVVEKISMAEIELPGAFFHRQDEQHYQPTEATIGPWSPQLQHGGPPIALLTRALRTYAADEGLRLARLTVEFLGPVPLEICTVTVEVVRAGRRIELLTGRLSAGGKLLLLAHAWRLKAEPALLDPIPHPFALPELPAAQPQRTFTGVEYFPYYHALEWRFSEGALDKLGPATVWTRPRIPLVDDEEIDGLDALVLMLDSANGVSAELNIHRWQFVPVDLTLGIYRHPVGQWFGMAARTTLADDGIGQSATTVFDGNGPLGQSLHTLFVRPR